MEKMEYDSRFIDFCENQDDDLLYFYLRYFLEKPRDDKDFWGFDKLYNAYLEAYHLEKEKDHYDLCKFYAFDYFCEAGIKSSGCDNGCKNDSFYTGQYAYQTFYY